ncbi:16S rRNA (guanine(966)-N(2))-methyltransferase RsmD [Acaricomes phytoseiuli]|uniref:16S rRNA (guanine(966)-N(2))-methyltransferase RsmD n=1 Tax=Acaricomes phytoseiuli TaxID=291968 RepID=UPI00036B1800|nr:16S rRNA (guanine(966)-N(2))-methyltransferase RsmD [Acaricomes phytoseiuli]MCW1249602.1 16S rRNA (guanine(966)-N(2))-methyltransferase RsmD [Acaricomes phytoseiuli]
MSRIIAGVAGGHPLFSVPGEGTRPTTDRVKEALFSRLEALGALQDARVLDLYAGSGALGAESASRGAREVLLIEANARAAEACRRNAQLVNRVLGAEAVQVHQGKAEAFLRRHSGSAAADEAGRQGWDLVFTDPPYALGDAELAEVLGLLLPQLAADAVIVVERSSRSPEPHWPAGMERFAGKAYGETQLWFAETV